MICNNTLRIIDPSPKRGFNKFSRLCRCEIHPWYQSCHRLLRPIRNIARTSPSRVLKRVNNSVFVLKLRKPTVLVNRAAFERIVDSSELRRCRSHENERSTSTVYSMRLFVCKLLSVPAASLSLPDLGSFGALEHLSYYRLPCFEAGQPIALAVKLQRPISVAIRVAFLRTIYCNSVLTRSFEPPTECSFYSRRLARWKDSPGKVGLILIFLYRSQMQSSGPEMFSRRAAALWDI